MPAQTNATPEMVAQMPNLEEAEITEEGARPLTTPNPAPTSPVASIAGAPAEPAVSAAEAVPPTTTQPAPTSAVPAPTATPTTAAPAAPVLPQASQVVAPVVEVVADAPVAAPAPGVAPAAATPPATEAAGDDLGKLGTFLKDQGDAALEEAKRTVQSQHDRQAASVARDLEASHQAQETLKGQIRDLQTRELSPEEKEKVQKTWAQEDERESLDTFRSELTATHRSVTVDSLFLEFKGFGVTREGIEAIKTPEEMELYCEHEKSGYLERELVTAKASVATAPTAVVATPLAPAPSAPAPITTQTDGAGSGVPPVAPAAQPAVAAEPPQPNAPGVPAGATAPSDIGSSGSPSEPTKFSEESSEQAFQENLRRSAWTTVRVRN